MESYTIREVLHKTIDTQLSKLLNSFQHLLSDSKMVPSEHGLESIEMSGFQLRIHHLAIEKALRMFLQIASDLDLMSALCDHEKRLTNTETVRRDLERETALHLAPDSVLSREVFSLSPLDKPSEEDDDVVFEGRAAPVPGEFGAHPALRTSRVVVDLPQLIPLTSSSHDLLLYP